MYFDFVSHPKTKPFLVIIGIGIAVAAVGIAILSVTVANSDNFRLQRVISWLNPEATADTGSFRSCRDFMRSEAEDCSENGWETVHRIGRDSRSAK